ncbi:14899_t:CDS:2, partial [Cetraspora pellucida]
KAIQKDLKKKVIEIQEQLRMRAFILRMTKKEGWNMKQESKQDYRKDTPYHITEEFGKPKNE